MRKPATRSRVAGAGALAVASLIVIGSSFAAMTGPRITGFGATLAVWNTHHREDRRGNLAPGCCYDPIAPHDGLVYADRYFNVQPVAGHVVSYEIWTGNRANAAAAKQVALRELPSDARTRSFTVHGSSCAILILDSKLLGTQLHGKDGGEVIVEFSSGPASASYNPRTVNDLIFSSRTIYGPGTPGC